MWAGVRVLAAVDLDVATLIDQAGNVLDEHPDIAAALGTRERWSTASSWTAT